MQATIKSFVLRAGRVSKRQKQALDVHLQQFELPLDQKIWDFSSIFKREAETIVEIGFGMGSSLLTMAKEQPLRNFIGIEVHRAGIGSLTADLIEHNISNVRIATIDAVEIFKHYINSNSLQGVQIFFPDPWPKKKHHKRRLIQPDFVKLIASRLKTGGLLHCATDWQEYAEHMQAVLAQEPMLCNVQKEGGFIERPAHRPLTKFELRGTKLGHGVWDLLYMKQNANKTADLLA